MTKAPNSSRPTRTEILAVPAWLDQMASWSWRLLLIGVFALAALWVLLQVRLAAVPALIAVVLASALYPVTRRLRDRGTPRALAATVPLLLVAAVLVGGFWFAGQRTADHLEDQRMQSEEVAAEIRTWLASDPFNLSDEEIADLESSTRETLIGGVRAWGSNQGGLVLSVTGGAVLMLALTFLFLKDGDLMWEWFVRRFDVVRQSSVNCTGPAAVDTISAYMRSVLLAGLFDAVAIGGALIVLGVPLVIPLMILTFVAALFPLIGAVVAGLAAAVVALVTVGPQTAIWVAIAALVVQQVEGNVVLPLVVGRQASLHPAAVLLALSVGGTVAGLAGAFLAVPMVAGATAALGALQHRRSDAGNLTPVEA